MRNCQKCGSKIPWKIKIDVKEHNLKNRKYCLICSPFGLHNTVKLNCEYTSQSKNKKNCKTKNCKICGKSILQVRGAKCWSCASKLSRERHANELYKIMGAKCWVCGYNKCKSAMDYHHVDPSQKKFNLTMREMQYAWHRILEEVKKCALLCCRCHREYHDGLIGDDYIKDLHRAKWAGSSMAELGSHKAQVVGSIPTPPI